MMEKSARCIRIPFKNRFTHDTMTRIMDDASMAPGLFLSLSYPGELRHPGYGVTVPMTTHVGLWVTSPDQLTLDFCSNVKSFPKHRGTKESFTETRISEKDETLR